MNKKYIILATAALFLAASTITSCSKGEESPEPSKKTKQKTTNTVTPPPPPPPSTDTAEMFTTQAWTTKKLYNNGVEQTGHFLIDTYYIFSSGGSYSFNIPGFPSASGTWAFDANGKKKVNVTSQAGTKVWNILSISSTNMVVEVEETAGNVWKYEYSR